ncbi:MAG: hypothetical protein LAO77_16940 [Acidobacteriia bacterium]|nr:hypothetical protein [Terriglobia bacterium]
MTGWNEVFLGVIAVATLSIAIAQLGIFVAAGLLARRMAKLVDRVEQELKPIFGHLDSIGRDAARATALATAQMERADKLFASLASRVEQTASTVQSSIGATARSGSAIFNALRAAFEVIRELRQSGRRRQGRSEDEDALFI